MRRISWFLSRLSWLKGVVRYHFGVVARAQAAPNVRVNVVGNEANRTICNQDVHAAGMAAVRRAPAKARGAPRHVTNYESRNAVDVA